MTVGGGRPALALRRRAAAQGTGVRGVSSQETTLALVGGEGRRSRTPTPSDMTASPGDGGPPPTPSSTAIDGIFPAKVVFFLETY